MTDEQMDARLRAAGERWRDDNPTVAVVEPTAITEAVVVPTRSARRRWGLFASAAVIAAALVLGGSVLLRGTHGAPTPSGDTAALEGHVWLLSGPSSTASLYIDRDGNLVADDACRLIGGTAALDGATMTVTHQVVRYKSCTDQYEVGLDGAATAVLDGASTYTITSDALTITKSGKDLRFTLASTNTPAPTLDFPTFVGANWALVSATDADGNSVPVAGDPTLHLGDDGKLTGSDGCNNLDGTVAIDGNHVTFGPVGGTEKYCPGDAGATEDAILAFMRGTAQETVVGGELTLAKGKAQLGYRWAPTSAATDPAQLSAVTWTLVDNAGTAVPAGTNLSVCAPGASACEGCPWAVAAGTLRPLPAARALGCTQPAPLAQLIGVGHSIAWSVYDQQLYLYLDDSQATPLVFTSGSTPPPSAAQLVGPTWHLTSIKTGTVRYRNGAPPAEESTLTVTDDGFNVRHVCYGEGGEAHLTAAAISFGSGHTTYAYPCPMRPGQDGLAAQLVDSVLSGTVAWVVDGNTLTLTKGGTSLTYSSSAVTKDDALVGTRWRLETAVDEKGTELPATGQAFAIDTSGLLVAEDGSNAINAHVTVHDGTLGLADVAVGGVGSTVDDPVRDVVDTVLQQGDVGYAITGDALTLTRGSAQLIYRAR